MKFATTIFFGLMASVTAGKAQMRLLKNARKLEDGDGDNQDEDEYSFLMNYNLKMIGCAADEKIRNPESGEYEYGAAIFRLCPEGCDNDLETGCSSGHGDYVVGLSTFVQAYFEDQRDNMYYDDNFKVDEYAECREYEQENDDGNNNNAYAYYIGPACTDDGKDVKLAMFYDEACSQIPEEVTFEDISNGWAMPYGDGGLVTQNCQPCAEYDDGNYALKEMCTELYENAGKCETNMETVSQYGAQEGSCEYITSLMPAMSSGSGAKAFGWVVFSLVVVGAFSAYAMWWKKKKAGQSSDGLMA